MRVVTTIERANGLYRAVECGKSKAARRTLKMPEFLREILLWHLKAFLSDEWVFPAPEGGFLRYDNFRPRVWNPAVKRAGLAPLTFHELRHTAAAFMINDGADPLRRSSAGWATRTSARPSTRTATGSRIAKRVSLPLLTDGSTAPDLNMLTLC